MIDSSDVIHILTDIIPKIEKFDPNTAFLLRSLNDAVKNDDAVEMDAWASCNIYQVIDPNSVSTRFQEFQHAAQDTASARESTVRLSRSLRNIGFFLPVILTCYALSQAATRYASVLAPGQTPGPFLYLWQQGFGGTLPSWLTFSSVAAIDVLLLLLLFLLTLMIHAFSRTALSRREQQARTREREAQEFRVELGRSLAVASLYLARQKRPQAPGDNLERVARRLDTTARKMEEKFEHIANQFDGLTTGVTGKFELMTQHISGDFSGMAQNMTDKIEDVTQQLTHNFADTTQDVQKNFSEMTRQVGSKFDLMTQNVVGGFSGMTQQVSGKFESMTQHIGGKFEGMTQQVGSKFESMTQGVTENFSAMSQQLTGDFEQMTRHVTSRFDDTTQGVMSRLEEVTQHTASNLETMTQQVARDLEEVTRQVEQQSASTTQQVSANFDGLIRGLTATYTGMAQQVTGRFEELAEQMLEQMQQGGTYLEALGRMTGGVMQTAEQIRQAAEMLKATNGELVQGMSNLLGPATELAQHQDTLIDAATRSLRLLQQVATTMTSLSKKQDRWGTDLRNILDTLDLTIERATELVISLGDFSTKQDVFLDQVQQERKEQGALITLLASATGKTPGEHDETRN